MFSINKLDNILRKLAKENKWQSIFTQAKELKLKLFENEINLTDLQLKFLDYLNFYSIIYFDIALGEIDIEVLENSIYEDAYMFYRRKKNKEKSKLEEDKKEEIGKKNFAWVFRKSNRK